MFTVDIELWEVRNLGQDPKMPVEKYPRVQKTKIVVRDENGRFHGATNFRRRSDLKRERAGTVSVVRQRLRVVS